MPRLAASLLAWMLGLTGCAQAPSPATPEVSPLAFRKHVLTTDFLSEGAAVADVDRDGDLDLFAGPYWFEAPAWTPHAFRPPERFDPKTGYSDAFLLYADDVDADGWPDLIRFDTPGGPASWHRNPQGAGGFWPVFAVDPGANNEAPTLVDLDGDGRRDLLFASAEPRQMAWFSPPAAPGDTAWTRHPLSAVDAPGTDRYDHGLGAGDLDGDGDRDVLVRFGWWEAPDDPAAPDWTFHPVDFGPPSGPLHVVDFDRDGDADVLGSSAHDYGIWWMEQQIDEAGRRTWTRHPIYDAFSQTHGSILTDLDADGDPDLITGKRVFAHLGNDPGGRDAAVLYWFELDHDAGGRPTWTPHRIDDASGIGLRSVAADVDADGDFDLVVANKNGVFFFEQDLPSPAEE